MNKRLLTYSGYAYLMSYALVVTLIGPSNAHIAKTFDAGPRAMGLLVSAHYGGFFVTTLLAGWMIDRFGLKPVTVWGSALMGLSLFGFGKAWSTGVLYFMMFLTGVGGGAMEAAVNALISTLYPDTRLHAMNKLHIFFGVGAFTWPMIAGWLLLTGATWRAMYASVGVVSLLITALMWPQAFPRKEMSAGAGLREMFGLLRKPVVLLLGGVVALYLGGEIGINAWIVRYFDEELMHGRAFATGLGFAAGGREFSLTLNASIFLTLYWFTMTVGRFFSTAAGRRVPDVVLLRTITLASAICAITTFSVHSIFWTAFFLALTGFAFAGIFPTTLAIGGNRCPDRLGSVNGLIIAFSGVGNVVLSASIGQIAQSTGSIRAGLFFAAALLAGMAACAFAIKKAPAS